MRINQPEYGAEALCVYRGKVTLDGEGRCAVRLPEYFPALTREEEATVILTPIGPSPFPVSYDWRGDHGAFEVFGEAARDVSYFVMAERDDATHRFYREPVEQEKEGEDVGRHLCPQAHGRVPEPVAHGIAETADP